TIQPQYSRDRRIRPVYVSRASNHMTLNPAAIRPVLSLERVVERLAGRFERFLEDLLGLGSCLPRHDILALPRRGEMGGDVQKWNCRRVLPREKLHESKGMRVRTKICDMNGVEPNLAPHRIDNQSGPLRRDVERRYDMLQAAYSDGVSE